MAQRLHAMITASPIIYPTGCTPDGVTLLGGIWTLWHQEGFPLEMSHLVARDLGCRVDWLEAMADASRSNNCPALMNQIEFLGGEVILMLKLGFARVLAGKTCDQILADKKANGAAFTAAKLSP